MCVDWIIQRISNYLRNEGGFWLLNVVRFNEADCQKILNYARLPLLFPFSTVNIADCLVNIDVENMKKHPKLKYTGEFRKNIAAIMIQKRFRTFVCYQARISHYKRMAAANRIINKWKERRW
jgi:hypothetical protein